jgi:hypothetical protein
MRGLHVKATYLYGGKLRGRALRDVVETVVRKAAPLPISTTEVCKSIGTYRYISPTCGHFDCTEERHLKDWGERDYTNTDVLYILKALVKRGLAEEHQPPRGPGNPYGAHYWRWIGDI